MVPGGWIWDADSSLCGSLSSSIEVYEDFWAHSPRPISFYPVAVIPVSSFSFLFLHVRREPPLIGMELYPTLAAAPVVVSLFWFVLLLLQISYVVALLLLLPEWSVAY